MRPSIRLDSSLDSVKEFAMPEDSEEIDFYVASQGWQLGIAGGAFGILLAVLICRDVLIFGVTIKLMALCIPTILFIVVGVVGVIEFRNSDFPALVFGRDAMLYRDRPWRRMINVRYDNIMSSIIIRVNQRGWKYYAQIGTFDGRNITLNGDSFVGCSNETIVSHINERLGREPLMPAPERWWTTS
jgi:hypothetical protein